MAEREIDKSTLEQAAWRAEPELAREAELTRVLEIGQTVDLRIRAGAGKTEVIPYEVTRFLGAGAQGQVFLVSRKEGETRKGPPVMVAKISPVGGPTERGNLREYLVQGALTRGQLKNLVTGVDISPVPEGEEIIPLSRGVTPLRDRQGAITHYAFCMEYIEGSPLEGSLEGRLENFRATLADLLPVTRALAELHSRGIAHGDIKPENVLLETDQGGKRGVRLIDLGLACFCTENKEGYSPQARRRQSMAEVLNKQQLSWDALTPRQLAYVENPNLDIYTLGLDKVSGTLIYMAPEKITWPGEGSSDGPIKHGRESDLYSLGVLMIEKLFGRKVLQTKYTYSPFEIMWTKLQGKYIKWADIEASDIGRAYPELVTLVKKLTDLDPDQRGTAREVAGELQRILSSGN